LDASVIGKGGKPYTKHAGLCLESQVGAPQQGDACMQAARCLR